MSEEEKQALIEMKQNCLNASVYDDEKRLLKANAITMALMTIENLKYDNKLLKDRINKAVEYMKEKEKQGTLWFVKSTDELFSLLKGDKE